MPLIDAALPALEQYPDGVFVEVTDPNEHILIAKSGGSIVIDVTDPDDFHPRLRPLTRRPKVQSTR